jgi:hypothetical protein
MEQYIKKSALVAEFNRLIAELVKEGEGTMFEQGRISAFEDTKLFLDTLEVKEVDLEKEINKYISDNFFGSQTLGFFANRTKEEPNDEDIALVAKHFFEFGLKSKSSYVDIPNIDDTLKEMGVDPDSKDVKIFKESFYEALEKFKAQKGE